jgi:hypothetical protein
MPYGKDQSVADPPYQDPAYRRLYDSRPCDRKRHRPYAFAVAFAGVLAL